METLRDAHFLLTQEAQAIARELLVQINAGEPILAIHAKLRKRFSASQVSSLITLAQLRHDAGHRFPKADKLFFTREALEQATAWEIAQYRAQWIDVNTPPGRLLDLGCGIGGDLIHLAKYRPVVAYEVDPVRACFAQANIEKMGLTGQVEIRQSDWIQELRNGTLPKAIAVFTDPARRVNGKRIFNVEQMIPPLSEILRLQQVAERLCIKIMPGIQKTDIPKNARVTFISHQKVCKEAMLWLDSTNAIALNSMYNAAIFRDGMWHEIEASQQIPPLGDLKTGFTLHEPDPAIIRVGAFWEICQEIDGWLLDPQIAYILTAHSIVHPLLQSFQILEVHPFNLRKLNRRISVLGIGSIELKKRGMPFEPESIRKQLKLVSGGRRATIIFTRSGEERLMIIAERMS